MSTETIDTLADVQPLADAEVDAALSDTPDAEAPYGRKADGTPKRRPGRPPKAPEAAPGAASSSAPPKTTKRRTASPSPRPKAGTAESYAKAVGDLLSLPVGILGALGAARESPVLVADAAVIDMHGPAFAAAVGDLAMEMPPVAAILDRLTAAGPYAALLTAVAPIVLQLGANHGMIPVGILGTQQPAAVTAQWIAVKQAQAAEQS